MEGNPWSEFRIFIGIGILLWIAWFLTGGVQRYDETKPYVEKPNEPGIIQPVEGPGYLLQ
jgi:hypothetical protein